MTLRYTTTKPCTWVAPRPYSDASIRRMKHGKVLPMKEQGFFARLFGRMT